MHTARANPPLFVEPNCDFKCQATMTADQFLIRVKLVESSAQEFASAHCGLVFNAIDFDMMVNDVVKS